MSRRLEPPDPRLHALRTLAALFVRHGPGAPPPPTAGSPRDNVILELGMFLGLHGQERALILRPRGADLKIPSDLLGITPLDYDAAKAEEDPIGAIATPANKLRRLIAKLGPRT